jgi:hypothetical protein
MKRRELQRIVFKGAQQKAPLTGYQTADELIADLRNFETEIRS